MSVSTELLPAMRRQIQQFVPLAFITYHEHSLNVLSSFSSQPRLNMPNDLGDVSKLTYNEVLVKARSPSFSRHIGAVPMAL